MGTFSFGKNWTCYTSIIHVTGFQKLCAVIFQQQATLISAEVCTLKFYWHLTSYGLALCVVKLSSIVELCQSGGVIGSVRLIFC